MPLPFFKSALKELPEPYRTMVALVDYYWMEEYFQNWVILGEYNGKEQVNINAWFIVGIAPGHNVFLGCSEIGNTMKRKLCTSKFREAAESLSIEPGLTQVNPHLIGGMVQAKLGRDKVHVIGIITIHETLGGGENFVVLWKHPDIKRSLVNCIMKYALTDKFREKT